MNTCFEYDAFDLDFSCRERDAFYSKLYFYFVELDHGNAPDKLQIFIGMFNLYVRHRTFKEICF
jgi:hypothetical protein